MKTFTVSIDEIVVYQVEVEAKNELEAENMAHDVLVNAKDRDQYFHAVVDRIYNAKEKFND